MLYKNYAEKSTAFLVDELITLKLRFWFANLEFEKTGGYTKEYDFLAWEDRRVGLIEVLNKRYEDEFGDYVDEMVNAYFSDNPMVWVDSPVYDLIIADYRCWCAQEIIMNSSLTVEARLAGAVEAQMQNAKRSGFMGDIDILFNEGYRTALEKTYSYFKES